MAKKKSLPEVDVTPLQAQVVEKRPPGCLKGLGSCFLIIVMLVLMVYIIFPKGIKLPVSPTPVQLPTSAATDVAAVATNAEAATTNTDVPSTPSATITETPMATATITSTPTISPSITPPESVNDRLENDFAALSGITQIDIVSALPMDAGGYIVYSEVMTVAGADFEGLAEQMQQSAFATLVSASLEFTVIFNDGKRCADYTFDNGDDAWRITPLTCPNASSQSSAPPIAALSDVMVTAQTMYYAGTGGANLRSCPKASCSKVASVASGAALTINGMIDGDSVEAGNSVWYRLAYGGQEAYVYSGVVSLSAPASAQSVAPVTSGGQSSPPPVNSFTCPSNCDGAVAMGLSAQQAAQCPGLDRDKDGVACYGD